MSEHPAEVDFKELFDEAPCGYLLVDADGVILRANKWVSRLLRYPADDVDGKRLRDILGIAGRVLYETNLVPLLRLQQNISEVALDLRASDGVSIPVIMGASSVFDHSGLTYVTRIIFVQAGGRRQYERELINARNSAEQGLLRERHDGELREQFIAVLGHDLRNPLASITAATRLLSREALSDRGTQVLGLMQGSALRMSGLIDNVLDFARARLGGGIGLDMRIEEALEPLIDQIVQELRSSGPGYEVVTSYAISRPVSCDGGKIGQLVSNLLGNAMTHGDKEQPIRLHAETTDTETFLLWIANGGPPIPPEAMPKLFDPFVRGEKNGYKEGLGLGLFIAQEIAKAHGGSLSVMSTVPGSHSKCLIANAKPGC